MPPKIKSLTVANPTIPKNCAIVSTVTLDRLSGADTTVKFTLTKIGNPGNGDVYGPIEKPFPQGQLPEDYSIGVEDFKHNGASPDVGNYTYKAELYIGGVISGDPKEVDVTVIRDILEQGNRYPCRKGVRLFNQIGEEEDAVRPIFTPVEDFVTHDTILFRNAENPEPAILRCTATMRGELESGTPAPWPRPVSFSLTNPTTGAVVQNWVESLPINSTAYTFYLTVPTYVSADTYLLTVIPQSVAGANGYEVPEGTEPTVADHSVQIIDQQ